MKATLDTFMEYNVTMRRRNWHILYFNDDDNKTPSDYFDIVRLQENVDQNTGEPYFRGIKHLYKKQPDSSNELSYTNYYDTLWDYMKAERLIDTRLVQQMLSGLDKDSTAIFHAERSKTQKEDDALIEKASVWQEIFPLINKEKEAAKNAYEQAA